MYVHVYCSLIVCVAEGLGVALPQHLSGLRKERSEALGDTRKGPGLPGQQRGVLCGCAAACLFVLGGLAGAGVFGVVVITGMAQP